MNPRDEIRELNNRYRQGNADLPPVKIQRATRDHVCLRCEQTIEAGAPYVYCRNVGNFYPITGYYHIECGLTAGLIEETPLDQRPDALEIYKALAEARAQELESFRAALERAAAEIRNLNITITTRNEKIEKLELQAQIDKWGPGVPPRGEWAELQEMADQEGWENEALIKRPEPEEEP